MNTLRKPPTKDEKKSTQRQDQQEDKHAGHEDMGGSGISNCTIGNILKLKRYHDNK